MCLMILKECFFFFLSSPNCNLIECTQHFIKRRMWQSETLLVRPGNQGKGEAKRKMLAELSQAWLERTWLCWTSVTHSHPIVQAILWLQINSELFNSPISVHGHWQLSSYIFFLPKFCSEKICCPPDWGYQIYAL